MSFKQPCNVHVGATIQCLTDARRWLSCNNSPLSNRQSLPGTLSELMSVLHKKIHFVDGEGTCKLCGLEDTVRHKFLGCEATKPIRDAWPELLQDLDERDDTFLHTPVAFREPTQEFAWWYFQHRPTPAWQTETLEALAEYLNTNQIIQCYTDGSRVHPTDPTYRRATFAAVWHPPVDEDYMLQQVWRYNQTQCIPKVFSVLFVAECQGVQTISRAELQALTQLASLLVEAAPEHSGVIADVHSDSQFVLDASRKLGYCLSYADYHKWPHADVLHTLWHSLQTGKLRLHKVAAHELDETPIAVHHPDTFHQFGNYCVDLAAKELLRQVNTKYPVF